MQNSTFMHMFYAFLQPPKRPNDAQNSMTLSYINTLEHA